MNVTGRTRISNHALDRWAERVPTAPSRAAAIKASLRRSVEIPAALVPFCNGRAQPSDSSLWFDPELEVIFVVDPSGFVLTCYQPKPGQAVLLRRWRDG